MGVAHSAGLVLTDRRFRGSADILPSKAGLSDVESLARQVAECGGFDLIYHDNQWRTLLTALVYHAEMPKTLLVNVGAAGQSQALGELEGADVTPETIALVQHYTENPDVRPPGMSRYSGRPGQPFGEWARQWLGVVGELTRQAEMGKRVAIVTHNRNIHAMDSLGSNGLPDPAKMNHAGPGPNTIHYSAGGRLLEWKGEWIRPGVYYVRHAETEWN